MGLGTAGQSVQLKIARKGNQNLNKRFKWATNCISSSVKFITHTQPIVLWKGNKCERTLKNGLWSSCFPPLTIGSSYSYCLCRASGSPFTRAASALPVKLWKQKQRQVKNKLLNLNLGFVSFYLSYSSHRIKQNITENCSRWYTRWREETLAVGGESEYITKRYKHLINRTNKHSEIISYTINNNWRGPAHTITVGRVMPLITYLVQASQEHNYFCTTFIYPHKTDINFNLNVFACSVRSEWADMKKTLKGAR